jgi:hypothetical protein
MENKAAKTLEVLLESLQPYPDMMLLLFASEWGILEATLLAYARRHGHTLLLYTLREGMESELPDSEALRHRPYRIEQPRYNLRGRLYNHAFVFGKIPDTPEAFSRKVYTGIANAGGLYLLIDPREPSTLQNWESILLASNYVAANAIDLDEERSLLFARKMHGWGG